MNILLEFYKNCLRYTTIGIGFLSAWVSTSMPDIVSKIVVSGVTLGILFMIAEWTIRNKIWRCCFLYRYLDFEDEWRCVTFYQEIESRDQSIINSFTPYHVYHEAKIDQDCRNIRISPSFGKVYNKWESIIMDLTASRGIAYAYAVEYTDGYKAKGYEELSVMQRFPIKNGKPILLEGAFAHCAEGQPRVLRGRAVFCSSKMFNKITVQEAMPEHLKESIKIIQERINKSA